ncbi:FtsK/SpoIIIE domain-containing protein [Desertimonas flava]|uniref:FtsK/SpoIIIE domain-containing protein n=1 Tax=Desertimonas flava TaxID=2064846 RepID=UPI0013C478BF|nr:FtsK/SpoIIIE domain-containing protein [Desertimonas flava]
MELLVRIRWRHAPAADLRFDVEPYHSVSDLVSVASEFCDAQWDASQPVYLERTAAQLPLDAPLLASGVMSGDTLRFELYGIEPSRREALSEALSCDVTAGPEAGRSFVLMPGRHEVGRGSGNQIVLHDPTVSDHHLSIVVYDDLQTTILPDTTATNPVAVNGRAISDATGVGANDVVQFGATAVALRVFSRSSDAERDQLGQVPFRRTPYKPVVVTDRPFKPLGQVPKRPEARRFNPVPAFLPMLMGLGMFAMTRQPYMLMMMFMSPVMLVANLVEGRKSARVKFDDQVADLRKRLERRKADVDRALLEERAERINQSPDLADLARRATLRTLDLWARQRGDAEFLRTRLGIGTVQSRVTVDPETTGEEYLRDAIATTLVGFDRLPASPICVNLAELGVFALHGSPLEVQAMCASVLLQAATLHSPEDLVIVMLEGHDEGLGTWVKWLPHTRSATSPLSGRHVIGDPGQAAEMVRELVSVARMRTADDRGDHRWPWVLVVLDESADVDPALASQLLELCPHAGISVVAAVASDARVPRQSKATFRCVPPTGGMLSTVWFTEPQAPSEEFEPEPANARLVDEVAMSLAPLRDATSASATAAIPRVVPLLSLFGPEPPTAMSVAAGWATPKPYGLRAPIGVGPSGPLELDLVEHGPHALIGGTSGAGKSELLQSIVASLIHEYPPTRLTFLFVDYKGGASSVVFNRVPHTVGYVTNLDASLSLRALTSLRAELNHRMRLMEGKAKDLAEMLERFPDEAPPSLVIVVDEFATLVKEVPDFVAGIVDIAQRGRSLGVHLILATQRPSGSVNDNILANTNLRISLRMLDAAESKTVIGVGAAADIPLPLKGRGFAKLGPRDLVEFQSAFTGAPLTQDAEVSPVTVERFGKVPRSGGLTRTTAQQTNSPRPETRTYDVGQLWRVDDHATPAAAVPPPPAPAGPPPPGTPLHFAPPRPSQLVITYQPSVTTQPADDVVVAEPSRPAPKPDTGDTVTHLDVLLEAVRDAAPHLPPPRKPWREMLPEELDWHAVEPPAYTTAPGRRGRYVTLGLLDDPAAQAQHPAVFDLEENGGLLIGGSGGSGKTTALRTAAMSAVSGATPEEVTLFVIDCASRSLAALHGLPHVAALATGDDLESLTRVIALLSAEIDRRRPILSDLSVQAENLSAYLDKGHQMPRIVVIVDGFQNMSAILGTVKSAEVGPLDWFAEFQRVVTDGRQLGVHAILAADRRQAVPALLMSAMGNRLVLRQTDENGYMDYGIRSSVSRGLELPSGRGLLGDQLVQVGLISDDPSAAAQGAALAAFAESQTGAPPERLVTTAPPDEVAVPLVASRPDRFTLGRTDVFGDVVEVSVQHNGLCVAGPPRSGRTTALRQAARSLIAAGYEVWSIGVGDDLGGPGRHAAAKADPARELMEDFAALCESFPKPQPYVLVVDNVDRLDDSVSSAYERVLKSECSRLLASLEARNLSGYTQNTLLLELRREPNMLLLQPDTVTEVLQYSGVRAQLRPGLKLTAGRGVLIQHRQPLLVQVALPD